MRKLTTGLLLLPLLCHGASSAFSQEPGIKFHWKWKTGQILELNEFHDVLFSQSNSSISREDRNRIVLKTKTCDPAGCKVDGFFDTYVRFGKTVGPFQKDKEFRSEFTISRTGAYSVPDKYTMPNLRSFPTFPERDILPGDHWKLSAEESFDFGSKKISVGVMPEYVLQGVADWRYENASGRSHKITFSYPLFYEDVSRDFRNPRVPYKITGQAKGTVFFNAEKGVPEFKDVQIKYHFTFPEGKEQEAYFHITGVYQFRESLDEKSRETFKENVIQDLIVQGDPKKGETLQQIQENTNISVRNTDEGISFSINSVLFDTNDSNLKEEAKETLQRIARILKKHKDREIRVSGHTDNVGKKDYNEKLSEDRARSVLQYLVDEQGLEEDRISYKGYGNTKPVASNDSEEGRAKNRRVEVLLVLD